MVRPIDGVPVWSIICVVVLLCVVWPVVHGDDPVVAGHDVECTANRRATVTVGISRWLHRLEDQVQMLRVLRQVGAQWLVRQALDQSGFQVHGGTDRLQVVGRAVVEIDPQQLALADPAGQARPKFDLAILSIRVIEADPRPAVPLDARRDQWTTASSTATRAAMNAVAYWSTSIDRSTCWLICGSIAPTGGIRVTV